MTTNKTEQIVIYQANILIYRELCYKIIIDFKLGELCKMQVEVDGKKIFYEVSGKGEPIVLIHGWLCTHETVKSIANHLSQKFKVYNIDMIGFGRSEMPDNPMKSDDYGDFLNHLIKALNIDNPILIGHSHGGRTIIDYAGRKLGNVKKIILIDSSGVKKKRSLKYYIKIYTFKFLRTILEHLPQTEGIKNMHQRAINYFGSKDYQASPPVLRKSMSVFVNEDLRELMPNIEAPTLLLWGDKDKATPLWQGKEMERLIPNSGLVVIEGGGHYSFLADMPKAFAAMDSFLK
jgi:pimeloyl-ACP methyl ester carboxylesterase